MNRGIVPYTLPDDAPDWLFVQTYAVQIRRDPRLLAGLRRPDGSLFSERKHQFTQPEASLKLGPDDTIKIDPNIKTNVDYHHQNEVLDYA